MQNSSKEWWFSLNMGGSASSMEGEILLLWWFNSLGVSVGYGLVAIYRDFLVSLRCNDFLWIGMDLHHMEEKVLLLSWFNSLVARAFTVLIYYIQGWISLSLQRLWCTAVYISEMKIHMIKPLVILYVLLWICFPVDPTVLTKSVQMGLCLLTPKCEI